MRFLPLSNALSGAGSRWQRPLSCLGAPCHARGCAHARSQARRCAPPRPALLPVHRGHPSFVVGTLRCAPSARNTTRARPDAKCELRELPDHLRVRLCHFLNATRWRTRRPGRIALALGPIPCAALLWAESPVCSPSGPKGPRRRLRRRVPVNPGRRAGDAAREAAARRAVGRVAADLPPRLPPEAWSGSRLTRRCGPARRPRPRSRRFISWPGPRSCL